MGDAAMKTYTFPYGKTKVSLSLPERSVIGELRGVPTPALAHIPAALYAALDDPVDSIPLGQYVQKGDRVALIVSDMSRFWMRQDLLIPPLLRYLTAECGADPSDITILVANGTHAGGDEQTLRTLVTDEVYDTFRVVNHDARAKNLTDMGATSRGTHVFVNPIAADADKVICLGACTHHVMAGFGGGRKSILPGICGLSTIRENHAHSLDPAAPRSNPFIGNGVLAGNPLHEDMCEAAAMMKSLFMVNLVMNADMKLAKIFAGHWLRSWEQGCRAVNEIYQVPIKKKADVIVTSCGGYPKDMSLYQGTKTIDNIESGLKIGGTLIIFMEAVEGGGPPDYFDWIKPLVAGTLDRDLRENFTIPGYIFYLNCEQARRYRILMYTSVPPEVVAPMGIEAFSDVDELLHAADLAGKSIYVIENGATVIPVVR